MSTARVEELPLSWFGRPQYRPRIRDGALDRWYLLTEAFRPPEEVPTTPPREPPQGRSRLGAAFEATYSSWGIGLSAAAKHSIHSVEQHGTAVVVTGQQPGFLGGPLHTLYKALGAIAAARRYQSLTGRPCVPVFWVAGDDHDFEEVSEARFPSPDGEAVFRFPGEADRRPVADHEVGPEAESVLAQAEHHFTARRHGTEACALIHLYRGRGLASAFGALLAELLGHTGLLVLDPLHVRPLASRIFRGVIEEPQKVLSLVESGRAAVKARGIEPFVAARLPLFVLLHGKRHHLSPAPGGLRVDGGGPEISTQQALQMLVKDPAAFSQGALLRPIVQEECLPCVLSIGGPAEVGYFAQLGPLAKHFGFEQPLISLRPNATIIDGKPARTASSIPLERLAQAQAPEDLLAPGEEPESLRTVQSLTSQMDSAILQALRELVPPGEFGRMSRRARDTASSLAWIADRLAKIVTQRRLQEMEDARRLWDILFPGGVLQERRWGFLHFVAKHGRAWIDDFVGALEPAPVHLVHRWITFAAQS